MLTFHNMVTVEVELDEETVRELSREAAQFEFQGSEPYVRWLIEHRAVLVTEAAELKRRLDTIESRLSEVEADAGTDDGAGDSVRARIDDLLAVTEAADDDEIEDVVATAEGTVDEDTEL